MKKDGWEPLDLAPKGWYYLLYNEWSAHLPENDLRVHDPNTFGCHCKPCWDEANRILRHHAFDGRDLVEAVELGHRIA